ncbi:MAG: flagellar filament capping protein FliD [Arcobacteraceae bacterium]|nr:flagellar filament capping protein FliD [Arcobacteraceae bacterium]
MSDYSSLGSFATGSAASLNGDLIQKLYDAEAKSRVEPLEKSLELWNTEKEKIAEINTKVNELITAVKPFDLFVNGNNAFEQISATTTGSSAVFDAADVGALKEGTYQVNISQLAQKDVWQSNAQTLAASQTVMVAETLTINGEDFNTDGLTLQELAEQINLYSSYASASVEQTGDDAYRLVLKSSEPGTANALTIGGLAATTLGFDDATDTDLDGVPDNHALVAQNMKATVDGVPYDVSSNSVQVDGNLKITATEVGTSTLSITNDDSSIVPAVQEMATKYNELLALITEEIYSEESSVQDKSSLKSIVNDIKNMMFQEYGLNDSSLLNIGFSFDKTGLLEIDTTVLGKALTDDPDSVKDLFIGVAEDKGFGTMLKESLDDLNSYNGLFDTYSTNMDSRKTKLEEDKEQAVKNLDTKYDTMAAQFAAYGSIISQMEASFGGLKMMIEQSASGN